MTTSREKNTVYGPQSFLKKGRGHGHLNSGESDPGNRAGEGLLRAQEGLGPEARTGARGSSVDCVHACWPADPHQCPTWPVSSEALGMAGHCCGPQEEGPEPGWTRCLGQDRVCGPALARVFS